MMINEAQQAAMAETAEHVIENPEKFDSVSVDLAEHVQILLGEVRRLKDIGEGWDGPQAWTDADSKVRCEHDNGFCTSGGKSCQRNCQRRRMGWRVEGLPRKAKSEITDEERAEILSR